MIHETAIIDKKANLAKDVSVGAYSIIGADVTIGRGSKVGSHVVVSGPSVIGEENQIFQFSSVGEAPQDKKYAGEPTWLELGDRNIIREFVTLNRGTVNGNGKTVIGSDNLFMAYAHVAHDCIIGDFTIFANAASLAGHVEIGSHSTLGGFTTVHQFTRIGYRAFCGQSSAITQDIPPYSIAAGNRAKTVGINKEGLKRQGYSPELIRALHQAFRELFRSNSTRPEALVRLQGLRQKFPEVEEFISFVEQSKRGIAH